MNPVPDDEIDLLADGDVALQDVGGWSGWRFREQAEITPTGDVVWAAL